MVSYEGIDNARPKTWATVADEWHALAKYSLDAGLVLMSTSTRRRSWAVPALVAASAGLLAAHFSFDGDTHRNCRCLDPSTRMYVTARAAPACALAALVPPVLLRRRGQRAGGAALAAVCLVPVLLLAQLAALSWVYEPESAGGQDCSGLTRIAARQ